MSPISVKNWEDAPSVATPITAAALEDLETRMGAYADTVTASDASTTVKGIGKLSVAPVSASNPIVVGDNDTRMTDVRVPTDGSVTNAKVNASASIAYSKLNLVTSLVHGDFAAANVDGTAGTPSLRTLSTTATTACAGNDSRLSDARTPSGTIAGHLTGSTWPTLNIATTATPQITRLGIGVGAGSTDALKLQTSAMSNRAFDDTAHGDLGQHFSVGNAGQRYNIYHGTTAAPVTTEGATFKVSRKEDFTADVTQGAESDFYSCIRAINIGGTGSKAQPVAISGLAKSNSTVAEVYPSRNPDALGFHGAGVIEGASVGRGLGGTFSGSSFSSASQKITGVEAVLRNENTIGGGTPATYSPTAPPDSMALHVQHLGTQKVAVGICINNNSGSAAKFLVGITIPSYGTNGVDSPVQDSSFRDNGIAATSLEIRGTHATAAIGIAAGAGKVGIGTLAPAAALHLGFTAAGADSIVAADGIQIASDITIYRHSAGLLKVKAGLDVNNGATTATAVGGQNAGVFSSTAGRIDLTRSLTTEVLRVYGTVFDTNPRFFMLGSGSMTWQKADGVDLCTIAADSGLTGLKIGAATTERLGFWNVTPIVQPTALTASNAALTDNTGGIADTTLAVILGVSYAVDGPNVRDNFADLAAQCNNLRTRLNGLTARLNASATGMGLVAGTN